MKKINSTKKSNKNLIAYSAMAGAFLATGAEAQVTYTDVDPDVTVDVGFSLPLDIDANGTVDFLFNVAANTAGNWSFGEVFGNIPSYSYGASSNKVIGYSGAILPYGSALNAGDEIGPTASFVSNSGGNVAFLASVYSSVTYGPFAGTANKFLGLQFVIDGDVHYGWVRLDATVNPVSLTIKDFAYEAAADTPLNAGDTTGGGAVLVVHQFLGDNNLTAYSYGNTVNIAVKDMPSTDATVKVFNVLGEEVYTDALNMNGMSFALNAATGSYILQVTSGSAVYTKQLHITN